jgi:hypothetical protein
MKHLIIGERKGSGPALPTRSPMARGGEIDTFTIPKGAQAAGVSTLPAQ